MASIHNITKDGNQDMHHVAMQEGNTDFNQETRQLLDEDAESVDFGHESYPSVKHLLSFALFYHNKNYHFRNYLPSFSFILNNWRLSASRLPLGFFDTLYSQTHSLF